MDTETTGLNPTYGDSIIEVALLQVEFDGENFREVGRFDSLVKPDMEVTERVSYITGITMDDLEDAPRFDEIRGKVCEFLRVEEVRSQSAVVEEISRAEKQPTLFSAVSGSDKVATILPTSFPQKEGVDTTDSSIINHQSSIPHIVIGHNIDFDLKFLESAGIPTKSMTRIDTMDLAGLFEENGKSLSLESLAIRHEVAHDAHRAMGDVLATFEVFRHYAQVIKNLPESTRDIFSVIAHRSDWPAKILFPEAVHQDMKKYWEDYLGQAVSGKPRLDARDKLLAVSGGTEEDSEEDWVSYPPGGGEGGVFSETLNIALESDESSVIQVQCPMQQLEGIIQVLEERLHPHPISPIEGEKDVNTSTTDYRLPTTDYSLVLHPYNDRIAKIIDRHPALSRPIPAEYVLDMGQTERFLQKPSWTRSQALFVLKLLKWIEATTTYNTKELQLKNSERPYLYALLPKESNQKSEIRNQKQASSDDRVAIYTLREYLNAGDVNPEMTPIVLDSTFIDEEVTNSAGETLTLHRVMSCLQAVEEMTEGEIKNQKSKIKNGELEEKSDSKSTSENKEMDEELPTSHLPLPTNLRSAQEKAAFFFAHLAHILQKAETKDLVLDSTNWNMAKVAESRTIAATLVQYIREIYKAYRSELCVALLREMERMEIFLTRFGNFDREFSILIQSRGNEEASLHITERDRTHLLNVLESKTERQIYIASPVRNLDDVLDVEKTYRIPQASGNNIATYIAEDLRPDQSLAYIEQLTTHVRTLALEKKEKCVFVLSHGKVIEQMVIPLQKELNDAGITFYAEKMAGSATKLRDFLANKPSSMLFCTLDFFVDLDESLLDFDLCVLQKLPFVMSKANDGDRNHFMDKVVPKSLYRFEQILCKLQRNKQPTDFILLDNKILQGGYADKFLGLLAEEKTEVMDAGEIVRKVLKLV